MDPQNPSFDVSVNDLEVIVLTENAGTSDLDALLNQDTSPISSWDALGKNLIPENNPRVDVSKLSIEVSENRHGKNSEKSATSFKQVLLMPL